AGHDASSRVAFSLRCITGVSAIAASRQEGVPGLLGERLISAQFPATVDQLEGPQTAKRVVEPSPTVGVASRRSHFGFAHRLWPRLDESAEDEPFSAAKLIHPIVHQRSTSGQRFPVAEGGEALTGGLDRLAAADVPGGAERTEGIVEAAAFGGIAGEHCELAFGAA